MAVMNKTLIIHHINDIDNIPAMERWFVHHHCPEVMAQEPWLTRYVMYRVMPPAKGMETWDSSTIVSMKISDLT